MSCHQKEGHINCKMAESLGAALVSKCIDCHMPNKESNKINFQTAGSEEVHPYLLRTHRIAIYPDEARRITAQLKALEKQN
jgi:hypothetical protein